MPVPTAYKEVVTGAATATKHTNPLFLTAAPQPAATTANTPQPNSPNSPNNPSNPNNPQTRIDFSMLTLASLRKYKRVHHLRIKPTLSKAELVQHVSAHFLSDAGIASDAVGGGEAKVAAGEQQIIDDFVSAVRVRSAGAADCQSPPIDNHNTSQPPSGSQQNTTKHKHAVAKRKSALEPAPLRKAKKVKEGRTSTSASTSTSTSTSTNNHRTMKKSKRFA